MPPTEYYSVSSMSWNTAETPPRMVAAANFRDAMGVNAAGDDLGNVPGRKDRF